MSKPAHIRSDYLHSALSIEGLSEIVCKSASFLKKKTEDFDAIAFTGVSGILVGPAVAIKLKKNLILVRQPRSSNHSDHTTEGFDLPQRYVIIDDLTSTGTTVHTIKQNAKELNSENKLIGILLYRGCPSDIDQTEYIDPEGKVPVWHLYKYVKK